MCRNIKNLFNFDPPVTGSTGTRVGTPSSQTTAPRDPTARATFLVDGRAPGVGDIQTQPLLADTLARTLIAPQQLPVGVLTALIGVPLFLFMLSRQAR